MRYIGLQVLGHDGLRLASSFSFAPCQICIALKVASAVIFFFLALFK